MDYSSMMQGVPQMGMPYNIMQRPSDMSRPRHTYSYPYNSDPVFLMPQIPPPHHHRTMADHQSMVHAKQTEPKPRLAKDEVLLLETEFAKNPKPSSQRKREIAELLKVDNPRINNWFQNRRAKAKQMLRREADPRAAGDESPSESSPSDHQEDSLVSEYYGSNQQSLPLRASSATFPAMEHHQQHQSHQQPALSIYPPANDGSLSHSTSPGSADEYPSPGSHHEMTYSMSGYMAPVQQQPQHNHHHHHYEQSYVPTTASMGIEIESMEPMMAQVGSFQAELLSIDDVPQLDKDLIVMPSCEVTQLDPNNRQVSPGSAASESESSPVLRLKSPPPPANLASRRNKGAPSLLSSLSGMNSMSSLNSAFRGTYGGSRVQKHAPRSPFFGNGNKEALLQAVSASGKAASPITPSSALLDETNSNSEYDGLPMQANPSSTSWSAYTDEALLTPSLASYGSDDFASLMHAGAPGYLGHMGSQPPTPSVTQPLGHGYFPVTTTSAQDYTFPGEYGMLAASSVKSSPSQSKKQFQFTQNVTPQDYSC